MTWATPLPGAGWRAANDLRRLRGAARGCARPPPLTRCCIPACTPIVRTARTRARAALAPRSPSRLRPEGPTPKPACPPRPRLTPRATPCVGALEGPFDLGRERRAEGRSGDGVARACSASAQVPVGKPRGGVGAASARLFARHRCPGHPHHDRVPHTDNFFFQALLGVFSCVVLFSSLLRS